MDPPPASVIFPPEIADVAVIEPIPVVVRVGSVEVRVVNVWSLLLVVPAQLTPITLK